MIGSTLQRSVRVCLYFTTHPSLLPFMTPVMAVWFLSKEISFQLCCYSDGYHLLHYLYPRTNGSGTQTTQKVQEILDSGDGALIHRCHHQCHQSHRLGHNRQHFSHELCHNQCHQNHSNCHQSNHQHNHNHGPGQPTNLPRSPWWVLNDTFASFQVLLTMIMSSWQNYWISTQL